MVILIFASNDNTNETFKTTLAGSATNNIVAQFNIMLVRIFMMHEHCVTYAMFMFP